MSLLELKQAVSQLSKRDRMELQAYLVRLRHKSTESKRATAKKIRAMKAGKRITAEQLEAQISRR
ncbi:MAG: hypothetical protein V4773_08925 [Verrucomicrobiota bacterium]